MTEEAFAGRNGTRLKVYSGYRCADGAETITGALFDTKTNARCYLSGIDPPHYCAPAGLNPDPLRDVRCDPVLMP